jgi:hypothetical protein
MEILKHLKNQILFAIVYIVIGTIALITLVILLVSGNIDGKLLGIFGGLTFGFLPLGILLLVDVYRIKRNPAMQKQIELKNEERNIFLRDKSGNQAFSLMTCLIFGFWLLSLWVNISSSLLFPILLGVIGVSYFTFLGLNARKY